MAQEPPPRHVSEFDHIWRDWLYFWWESINEYPAGGRGFGGLGVWRYQTDTGSTPPTGELQFDNLDIDSATNLYINETNDTGTDMSAFLDLVTIGDLIYIQAQDEATQFVTVQVGTPSVSAGVYTFPLTTSEAQGAQLADNQEVSVVITKGAIGIGGGDHGALVGLVPDDDHTQYLNKDITRNLTVGYSTDVEADTFTDPLVPNFQLEYFKTTTVTSNFTLDTPTANSHGEYYLTIDSGGPYTLTAGSNVVMMDSNVTMEASENYILNIHRYSATNTVAQLLLVSAPIGYITVEDEGTPLATLATTLDFVGAGVVASGTGVEKTITISGTDVDAIHDNVAAEISAITDKPVPVSGDHYLLEDSADSNNKKSVEHSALEAQFKKTHITVTSTSYTAAAFKVIFVDDDTAGSAVTITLPAAASSTDEIYNVVKIGTTASVTVDGDGSEEINGATTYVLSSQWDAIEVMCDGTQWIGL